METPFVTDVQRPYLTLLAAFLTALATGPVQTWMAKRFLRTPATSSPIVDWELAGRKARLDAILASWDGRRREKAGMTLAIDTVFLVAYGFGLSYASTLGAATFGSYGWDAVACVFIVVAWAAVAAAAMDAVENLLLAWTLGFGTGGDSLPLAIRSLARTKFFLLKTSVPVAVAGLVLNLLGCRGDCLPG